MKYVFHYNTPIGRLGIAEENGAVCRILFEGESFAGCEVRETAIIKKAAGELDEYFKGKRKDFDLPLLIRGTEFQKAAWKALVAIRYGETRNYKEIAVAIGSPRGARAVGMANNRNPLPIIIPCHRVIGADGSLTGYAGGLDMKKALLDLEKKHA